MIVREVDGFTYLIRQSEHARQSSVLLASLHGDLLPDYPLRVPLLHASAVHDCGWEEWDDAPALEETLLPADFQNMEKPIHREIWRRTILKTLRLYGPLEAALAARHAIELAGDSLPEETEHDRGIMLALLVRAWPELEESQRLDKLENLFLPLYFCDALSLIGCAGWNHELRLKLQDRDKGPLTFTARRCGDWSVAVDPWPFAPPRLEGVYVDAVAIAADRPQDAAPALKTPVHHLVRIGINYQQAVD